MQKLWNDLKGEDAARAYQAIGNLENAPESTIAWLQTRLRPVPPVDERKLAALLVRLEDKKYTVRTRAARDLEQWGDAAVPALKALLAVGPSLEVQRRVEQILKKIFARASTPEEVLDQRAVEVLERLGTAKARKLLRKLAQGAPGLRLTREAEAALKRARK